jgi:hypothetical protein
MNGNNFGLFNSCGMPYICGNNSMETIGVISAQNNYRYMEISGSKEVNYNVENTVDKIDSCGEGKIAKHSSPIRSSRNKSNNKKGEWFSAELPFDLGIQYFRGNNVLTCFEIFFNEYKCARGSVENDQSCKWIHVYDMKKIYNNGGQVSTCICMCQKQMADNAKKQRIRSAFAGIDILKAQQISSDELGNRYVLRCRPSQIESIRAHFVKANVAIPDGNIVVQNSVAGENLVSQEEFVEESSVITQDNVGIKDKVVLVRDDNDDRKL